MNALARRRHASYTAAVALPLLLALSAGCDVVTADLKHTEKAEWRKTYELASNGRLEISNVNGKIQVEPATGSAVEVVAEKVGRGATPDSAKAALNRIEISDEASKESVRVTTRLAQGGGWFGGGGSQVQYKVRIPAGLEARFTTVNGGVELASLSGRITAEATNGGVVARDVSGTIDASTTNGGVEVDLAAIDAGGAKLHCTNGGISLRLPADAKVTVSASITNGGIDAGGLPFETTESTRRRLEGRLNGGGPMIRLEGTNGGITISRR
jgi:Putative adhesin